MAHPLSLTSTCLLKFGLIPRTTIPPRIGGTRVSRSSIGLFRVRAVQDNDRPRRLVDIIRLVPEISRNYFRSPSRRALFGGISLLGGFYVAQTISLSFGALGVNDVIAAIVCVLLTEYVTRFYYSRPKNYTEMAPNEFDEFLGSISILPPLPSYTLLTFLLLPE
ncbi:hypothetical protein C3L33_16450, partial [Rhododendron williamsianum]